MSPTAERRRFSAMSPSAFEHPADRTALDVLRKTPGLDTLLKRLAEWSIERQVRLHFTADSLRLSSRQCPRLYALFKQAATALDVAEPELYLLQYPFPNAVAIGLERHTLVVTSAAVDLLDDDELVFLMGHELGHVKSGHMLYRTMAMFLFVLGQVAARNLPLVGLVSEALLLALFDWFRKSELTADRAGLLAVQDIETGVRSLLKLAGGTHRSVGQLSVDEFLKQADEYEDMDASLLNVLYKFQMTRFQTHPFPALRARELHRWAGSEDYRRILSGEYDRTEPAEERRCPRCAAPVRNSMYRYCPDCGQPLTDSGRAG